MGSVKLYAATLQDFDGLIKLADELIHLCDWSGRESMLKKSLRDPDCKVYVAKIDGKIVGFIELRLFPDFVEGVLIAIVQNLIVDKKYRNLGIGGNLLERAIEEAEERNAVELHVWTEFDNQQAINFYIKHGFKKRALLLEREMHREK